METHVHTRNRYGFIPTSRMNCAKNASHDGARSQCAGSIRRGTCPCQSGLLRGVYRRQTTSPSPRVSHASAPNLNRRDTGDTPPRNAAAAEWLYHREQSLHRCLVQELRERPPRLRCSSASGFHMPDCRLGIEQRKHDDRPCQRTALPCVLSGASMAFSLAVSLRALEPSCAAVSPSGLAVFAAVRSTYYSLAMRAKSFCSSSGNSALHIVNQPGTSIPSSNFTFRASAGFLFHVSWHPVVTALSAVSA